MVWFWRIGEGWGGTKEWRRQDDSKVSSQGTEGKTNRDIRRAHQNHE